VIVRLLVTRLRKGVRSLSPTALRQCVRDNASPVWGMEILVGATESINIEQLLGLHAYRHQQSTAG
jgi:hypothetical protein